MAPPHDASATPRNLSVAVASGDALDVRKFDVDERIGALFTVRLITLAESPNLDFDAIVGGPASFTLRAAQGAAWHAQTFSGICSRFRQIAAEEAGLSTYEIVIVPALWLATQRRNYRIFQQLTEPEIALEILRDWGVAADLRLSSAYKKRPYRVQYGESDYAFVCRTLEEAGVSFYFAHDDDGTRLVLTDAPERAEPRAAAIPFRDNPTAHPTAEHVTKLQIGEEVRPGRYTMRDHDDRMPPTYPLMASAAAPGASVEARLERFDYTPGAFLFGADKGDSALQADDRGKVRSDEGEAQILAQKRLDAERGGKRTVTFETNAHDLSPGVVASVLDHPRAELGPGRGLLIVASRLEGTSYGEWSHQCEARSADAPFRPALMTPKPKVSGVESATVVGAPGEEIHCDEQGRVRVHFHWDRQSKMDDTSSCWIPVSQSWGGAGFGGINLPRVGQEVIVDFLGGDPDRPVIVGRVFTGVQKAPYKLPEEKTRSGWRSSSTGGGGGFNEIMFDDASGREIFRMQAERDLKKTVKRDEESTVGNNRIRVVKGAESITIAKDRVKRIDGGETITIAKDRVKTVEGSETVAIALDRSKTVKGNETVAIEKDRTKSVDGAETITVGKNRKKTVKGSEIVTIEEDRTKTVEGDETVTIKKDRKKTVRGGEEIRVLRDRTKQVLGEERVTIGSDRKKTVEGGEEVTIKKDRKKTVDGSETVSIAKSLERMVQENVRDVTGQNRRVVVGVNRSTEIGEIDSTTVGSTYSVMVSPPGEGDAGGSCTCSVIKHDYIELSTSDQKAKIILSGGKITIEGLEVTVIGKNKVTVECTEDVTTQPGIGIKCKNGDVAIDGPLVRINTP